MGSDISLSLFPQFSAAFQPSECIIFQIVFLAVRTLIMQPTPPTANACEEEEENVRALHYGWNNSITTYGKFMYLAV